MTELAGPPLPSGDGTRPSAPEEEPEGGGVREVLRNRRFLLLEASGAFASAGYAVYSVSVLFLAYGITGNLLVAGGVLFLEYGIYTATFLIAPLVDRAADKRTILLVCYPLQAAAAGLLALGLFERHLTVAELLGLVAVLAVLWDFVWAVYMISPRILLPKHQLFVGSSITNVFSVGTQIGGYAGGGALLFFVGPSGGAVAYMVLLLAAALPAIPVSLAVDTPPTSSFRETFWSGWEAFRGRAGRAMRSLAGLEIAYGFVSSIPVLLIPAIAYERFAAPAAVYGVLVTAYALGGAAGGVLLGRLNPRRTVGWVLVAASLTTGVLVLLLDATPATTVAFGIVLAGVGAGGTIRFTAKYSWVQASYPPDLLGRLISNLYFFTGVSGSLAVLLVGLVSGVLPLSTLLLLDGAGFVATGVAAIALPSIRRLAF